MSARFNKGYFFKIDSAVYDDYGSLTVGEITEVPAVDGSGDASFGAGYFVPRT